MKRFLSLRNTLVVAAGLAGLLFVTSSFTFGPVDDAQLVGDDGQKKEQKIKVVVNVDGKETRIDTVFNLPDEKMINEKVDSMLSRLDTEGVNCKKMHRVMFKADKGNRFHAFNSGNMPGEQFDIMIENGDSGKCCPKKKVICLRGFDSDSMNGPWDDNELMPPPPPGMPPHAFIMSDHFTSDPFAFDTKDESVVSYEKKDIGNGLERITIVRKKHEEHSSMKQIKVRATVSDDSNDKKKDDEVKELKKLKDEAKAQKETKK